MAVGLVIGVVAFEPYDLAVALEGEDVGGDAIEKPAVMGDGDRAAGEIKQRFLERPERVDVEIVRRLIEQQDIGALLQHFG